MSLTLFVCISSLALHHFSGVERLGKSGSQPPTLSKSDIPIVIYLVDLLFMAPTSKQLNDSSRKTRLISILSGILLTTPSVLRLIPTNRNIFVLCLKRFICTAHISDSRQWPLSCSTTQRNASTYLQARPFHPSHTDSSIHHHLSVDPVPRAILSIQTTARPRSDLEPGTHTCLPASSS